MTTQESVVTPERFRQGHTWQEYLEYIGSPQNLERESPRGGPRPDNTEAFRKNDAEFTLSSDEIAALKAAPTLKLLVIGEDWCPDVHRGAPVFASLCAAAGWECRLFQRDENTDIIAEFLNEKDGEKFESIPVAVLYTADHRYVGHWIERPAVANAYMDKLRETFTRREGESDEDLRARIRRSYAEIQTSGEWNRWRHATVDEILAIAKQAPA